MNLLTASIKINAMFACLLIASAYTSTKAASDSENRAAIRSIEKATWQSVTTPYFTVITDKSARHTRILAENLERFRKLIALMWGEELLANAGTVKVIGTQSKSIYDMLTGYDDRLMNSGGWFADTLNGNFAVLRLGKQGRYSWTKTSKRILLHEYTHYLTASTSHVSFPLWYNEGIAEYFSTLRFDDEHTVSIGYPPPHHLSQLKYKDWLPIEELLKTTFVSHKDSAKRSKIYTQGWAMVHYHQADAQRSTALQTFLEMLAKGSSIDEAMRDGLGTSYEKLDSVLKSYSRKRSAPVFRLKIAQSIDAQSMSVRKLEPAQALYELGEHVLNERGNFDIARPMFERAIELQPNHVDALAGLANTYLDKPEIAREKIEVARELAPTNPWAATVAGHIYARLRFETEDQKERLNLRNLAIGSYNVGINNKRRNLEAISGAANLYASDGEWNQSLDLYQAIFEVAPSNESIRKMLMTNYFALNQTEKAEQMIELLRRNSHRSKAAKQSLDRYIERTRLFYKLKHMSD